MKLTTSQREEGQIIVILALALVVLLGFAGLAIDGGMIYADRRHEQNVADAAALAGAGAAFWNIANDTWDCPSAETVDADGNPDPITGRINRIAVLAAKGNAYDNGFSIHHNNSENGVDTACNSDFYDVVVTITKQTQTSFLQLIFNRPMINVVHATARIKPERNAGSGHAIISLNFACSRTGTGAGIDKGMVFNGNYDVNIVDGTVASNSCIVATGASGIVNFTRSDGSPVTSGGDYLDSYIPTGGGYHLDPPPSHTEYYEDVYIKPPDCNNYQPGRVISTTTTSTATITAIGPGTYNNIRVGGGGSGHAPPDVYILKPGLYCLIGGFSVDSDTKVYGDKVTIAMMGTNSDFKVTGSPHIELVAPTLSTCPVPNSNPACPPQTRAVRGLLIYSANNKETKSSGVFINGDANSEFTGTIYAPKSYVTIGGNVNDNHNRDGASTLGEIHSQIIGLDVVIHGTPNLKIVYDADSTPEMDMSMQLEK